MDSVKEKKPSAVNKAVEKKAPAKVSTSVYVQYADKEVNALNITDDVKKAFKASGNKTAIKKINVYIKPEENTAYYVINDEFTGSISL